MVEDSFDAAHCLRGYEGNCENLHGHTYRVQCMLRQSDLNEIGLSFDFKQVKNALRQIITNLDHSFLNDLEDFKVNNPTAENLAQHIYNHMKVFFDKAVTKVTVWETATSAATYFEE